MNVARLNMSHGDHASHKAVVDQIKEYNSQGKACIAIMLDTKVTRAMWPLAARCSACCTTLMCGGRVAVHCMESCSSPMLQR